MTQKITLAFLLIFSSLFAGAEEFKATFDIKGISSKQAYLTVYYGDRKDPKIKYDDEEYRIINVANGHFTIEGTCSESFILRVTFTNDKQLYKNTEDGYFPYKCMHLWVIIAPDSDIQITGDLTGKNFVDIYYDKDPENALLAELNRKRMPLFSQDGDIAVKLEMDKSLTDSDKKALEARSEELGAQILKLRNEFMTAHPSSLATLSLIEDMIVSREATAAEIEPMLEKIAPKYHNCYSYKSLATRVQGAKTASIESPCPPIEGLDQNDQPFNIESLRGKYVIIDFWGTWCGVCIAGMPTMREFRNAHSDKLQILGVANDKDIDKWKRFVSKNDMDWPNIMQGTDEHDYVLKFNVQGFPTKILLSPDGTILYRASGESEEFYQDLEKIMK